MQQAKTRLPQEGLSAPRASIKSTGVFNRWGCQSCKLPRAHIATSREHQHRKIYPSARCMRETCIAVATAQPLGESGLCAVQVTDVAFGPQGGCHLLLPGCVSHPELTFHAGLAWPAEFERLFYLAHALMLCAGKCRTVRIWRGGQCYQELADHTGPVQCVLVLPDGGILSGSNDMTIKLWIEGRCKHTFSGHTDTVR